MEAFAIASASSLEDLPQVLALIESLLPGSRRIGWHKLRHTFASHLVMRGAPLKAVQATRQQRPA